MLLNLREYHRPGEGAPAGRQRERLEQAVALLARAHLRTIPLAGGDNLVASADPAVEAVVDLQEIGLEDVRIEGGQLHIGSMVTRAALVHKAAQCQDVPGLGSQAGLLARAAARWSGSIQRNRATVGGAVAVAAANDPLVLALLASDAVVVLYGEDGSQEVPLADFLSHRGDFLAGPILITDLLVPGVSAPSGWALASVERTPADAPIVAVTAMLTVAGDWCMAARLALGGVADLPCRWPEAESGLEGQELSEALIAAVAAEVSASARPGADFRGSSEYRQAMVGVLSERALREAWGRAR